MKNFRESILALITETSANLPSDVRCSIADAIEREDPKSQAGLAMSTISVNIDMAVDNISPICQDTGMDGRPYNIPGSDRDGPAFPGPHERARDPGGRRRQE